MFIGEVLVAMAALHELGMRSTQCYASYVQASSSGHLKTSLFNFTYSRKSDPHHYSVLLHSTYSSIIHMRTSTPHNKKSGTIITVDTWDVLQCNKPVAKCILH